MGVGHVTTSPYYFHPSHTERFNKNLGAALIAYHSHAHDTWDQQLYWLQLAFNAVEHQSIKSPPFAVIFSFRSGSPLLNRWKIQELLPEKCNNQLLKKKWATVRQNLCSSRARVEERYNRNRVPHPFKAGDLVFYRNHPVSHAGRHSAAKLMPSYRGPFKIDSFLTPTTAKFVDPVTGRLMTRAHVSLLKPCSASNA
jgi:hypothetical protein